MLQPTEPLSQGANELYNHIYNHIIIFTIYTIVCVTIIIICNNMQYIIITHHISIL